MDLNPVSARALCRRSLRSMTAVLRGITLFPLFECEGSVRAVMMLAPDSPDIHLWPWSAGMARVPTCGAIRLADDLTFFRPVRQEDLGRLESLWHFDPWWRLDEDRYRSHWATSALRRTNCAGRRGTTVDMVFFRRDLSRLCKASLRRERGVWIKPWSARLLPQRRPHPPWAAPAVPAGAWRLDPIWTLWRRRVGCCVGGDESRERATGP